MASDFPISIRWPGPSILVKGATTVIEVPAELRFEGPVDFDEVPTYKVFDGEGVEVSAGNAAWNGAVFTITVPGADTADKTLAGNWQLHIFAAISSVPLPAFANAAVLCAVPILPPIGTGDMTSRYGQLAGIMGGESNLPRFIDEAWKQCLIEMYMEETPFWQLRSTFVLREWLIACACMMAWEDAASLHRNGVVYDRVARRLEESLPVLMAKIRARTDPDEDNKLSTTAAPVTADGREV